jgi:hypothetical protein
MAATTTPQAVVCDACRRPCNFDPRVAIVVREAGGKITCDRHPEPRQWTIRRAGVFAMIPGRSIHKSTPRKPIAGARTP